MADLDAADVEGRSYDTERSIGQVLAHLGSQAQVYELLLEAGLGEHDVPDSPELARIRDRWDGMAPLDSRDDALAAGEAEVARYESLDPAAVEGFHLSMSGTDLDLAGLLRMRLAERAVRTWDIAVMLDPGATVSHDAVALLVDRLGPTAARTGRPRGAPFRVRVGTTGPKRDFVVSVDEVVTIETAEPDDSYDGSVDLTAEGFLRLVHGRLDPAHTPEHTESGGHGLADLREVLPGFWVPGPPPRAPGVTSG